MPREALPLTTTNGVTRSRRQNDRCVDELGISLRSLALLVATVVRWELGKLTSVRIIGEFIREELEQKSAPKFGELERLRFVEMARKRVQAKYYRPTSLGIRKVREWAGRTVSVEAAE